MSTYSLKRCPWCNGHDLSLEASAITYQIKCFDCGAMGPRSLRTVTEAVRRWNGVVKDDEEGWTSLVTFATRRELEHHNRNDVKEVEL